MTSLINKTMTALIYTQTEMNLVVLGALIAVLIAILLGIRIGVSLERKDPEPKVTKKVRKLNVVNSEWFQPKNLIGKKEALEV